MKKIFFLLALGNLGFLHADQYPSSYGNDQGYRIEIYPVDTDSGNGTHYYHQGNQPPSGYYYSDDNSNWQTHQPGTQPYSNRSYDQGYYSRDNQAGQPVPQQGMRGYNQNPNYAPNQQGYRYGQSQDNNYRNGNQPMVRDEDIIKRVRDALASGWFSKGFQDVRFDIYEGNVTLKGTVDTLDNKNKVEDRVKKIEGVKYVNNQIVVRNEQPSSELTSNQKKYPQDSAATEQDRQLNEKIRSKLSDGWFSPGFEAIIIRTDNGIVVISGSVEKLEDIQKVNDKLKEVDGVRAVNNQLKVKE